MKMTVKKYNIILSLFMVFLAVFLLFMYSGAVAQQSARQWVGRNCPPRIVEEMEATVTEHYYEPFTEGTTFFIVAGGYTVTVGEKFWNEHPVGSTVTLVKHQLPGMDRCETEPHGLWLRYGLWRFRPFVHERLRVK